MAAFLPSLAGVWSSASLLIVAMGLPFIPIVKGKGRESIMGFGLKMPSNHSVMRLPMHRVMMRVVVIVGVGMGMTRRNVCFGEECKKGTPLCFSSSSSKLNVAISNEAQTTTLVFCLSILLPSCAHESVPLVISFSSYMRLLLVELRLQLLYKWPVGGMQMLPTTAVAFADALMYSTKKPCQAPQLVKGDLASRGKPWLLPIWEKLIDTVVSPQWDVLSFVL